ncbi:DUF2684 family protein [Atlantibacter subterranea]|uniref:DUF2684 family protein n=1 Tax=Atlantibacter subterraneus TaxID=255519 RepID=A0A3R9GBI4_9ENTR|nr:DUF2684 family protein [Atlantibacter subterranea]RSE05817.1 DUF2684 family protein [Atlantibacter subterranea]RSE27122.1 DUF2684 family protein [Atlantibacter subterranea]
MLILFFSYRAVSPCAKYPEAQWVYRWINIWTAILGHLFIPFPAIFTRR